MSTLVGIMVGSRQSTIPLVRNSIDTILRNVGDDVLIAVAVAHYLPKEFQVLVDRFAKENPGKVLLFPYYEGSWARFANSVISMSGDFRWVIFSHDDVHLISDSLIPKMESILHGKKDDVAWISFLDWDYLRTGWAPSVREGWHIDAIREDAWSRKKIHKYHNLPDNWYSVDMTREYLRSMPWDIPDRPVRCHGPFSHFIVIESEKLRKVIKRCEDWSPVSLLVDEDWGLTALKNNLYNVWIPQLVYCHMRMPGATRASHLIDQYGKHVHNQFRRKWGFPHTSLYTSQQMRDIKKRFGRTLLPWSMDRRSYEWDHVQ